MYKAIARILNIGQGTAHRIFSNFVVGKPSETERKKRTVCGGRKNSTKVLAASQERK